MQGRGSIVEHALPRATGWFGSRDGFPGPASSTPGRPGRRHRRGLWDAPDELVRQLAVDTEAPLKIGRVRLEDGRTVAGFAADVAEVGNATDISVAGGWRAHIAPGN